MPVICVDTSQTVIKKLFDAVAGDVSSSSSPSPPGHCLLSATGEFVGGGRGIMGEALMTELSIHCLFLLLSLPALSPCLPPLFTCLPLTVALPPPPP